VEERERVEISTAATPPDVTTATTTQRRRGRPPKKPPDTARKEKVPIAPSRRQPARSCRASRTDDVVESRNADDYESAVAKHLISHPRCRDMFRDSDFSVLCRASSVKQLEVLEAMYIHLHNPDLCTQKNNVTTLYLFPKSSPSQR